MGKLAARRTVAAELPSGGGMRLDWRCRGIHGIHARFGEFRMKQARIAALALAIALTACAKPPAAAPEAAQPAP
ncbi:hypothetical protein, partial [Lysobacter enzymogenes]|uniref:hypothetical protein n=1 Tax=Lysobacter enzymogenes TaxID=69 RepID=UPI0019D1C27B